MNYEATVIDKRLISIDRFHARIFFLSPLLSLIFCANFFKFGSFFAIFSLHKSHQSNDESNSLQAQHMRLFYRLLEIHVPLKLFMNRK